MSGPAGVVSVTLLTDQVFDYLRGRITSGELPAGARLRVRDVAAEVGTSVMPVREAIRRLEEAGLAEREPHRGAVVKGVTLTDLLHIYDIRLLLETDAARRGAVLVTTDATALMREQLHAMDACVRRGDLVGALDRDEDFLRVLYGAQTNTALVKMVEELWRKCRIFKTLGAAAAQRSGDQSLWTYQVDLLQAAEQRDADLAAEVTQASLLSARQRIEVQLQAQSAPAANHEQARRNA